MCAISHVKCDDCASINLHPTATVIGKFTTCSVHIEPLVNTLATLDVCACCREVDCCCLVVNNWVNNVDGVEVVVTACVGDCQHAIGQCFVGVVFLGEVFPYKVAIAKVVGCVFWVTVDCNLCAFAYGKGEGTVFNLRVVATVVFNCDTGEIYATIFVVTFGTKFDGQVFFDECWAINVDVGDVGVVPNGRFLCANVNCFDDNRGSILWSEHVLSICVHCYRYAINKNVKLTVGCVVTLNCYRCKSRSNKDDLRV